MTDQLRLQENSTRRRRSAAELRRENFHITVRTLRLAWHAYAKDKTAVGALIFMAIVVLLTILAPYISPHDPTEAVGTRGGLPGTDGLIIEDRGRRALFLPVVWKSLPTPAAFVARLKTKAGMGVDHWSDAFKAWRLIAEERSTESLDDPASVWGGPSVA